MKQISKNKIKTAILVFLICISTVVLLESCKHSKEADLQGTIAQQNAVYTQDKTFGNGEKTVMVTVITDDNSVKFTLNTDKDTLGDALKEYELIEGDNGAYGLYVKKVNGIRADYDSDKAYWAFFKDGSPLEAGVDSTQINSGDSFEIRYTPTP
ncbi:MAG: DUF4430 domain-containing protein [Clostridia bacterium]|nr:DUF4430 domain-containing protein [Clostridia bacterium]MDY3785672.1 DUF4430 domain-containing protein [Eubacteriales bacterium]